MQQQILIQKLGFSNKNNYLFQLDHHQFLNFIYVNERHALMAFIRLELHTLFNLGKKKNRINRP